MILEEYKFFTVIVPTYNRAESLKRCLGCLVQQVEEHKDQVRIYVSDNASEDNTKEVVENLQSQYPDILYYFRQPQNITGNPNFRHAVNNVNSKYVCLLGDDDYIRPQYLDTVLRLINDNPNAGLVYVNCLGITENHTYGSVRDTILGCNDVIVYKNGCLFFKDHLDAPSLMSSNIFLREEFIKSYKSINNDDYPGYNWFAAMAFSVVDKCCVYYSFPMIEVTQFVKKRWSDKSPAYYIVGLGRIFRKLDEFEKGIEVTWKNHFLNSWFRYNTLSNLRLYRHLYKDKINLLSQYSPSPEFTREINAYVKFSSFEFYIYRLLKLFVSVLIKIYVKCKK